MFTSKIQSRKSGFTLVEILVVVAILGLLMAVTTSLLTGVGQKQGAARSKADMAVIASATEAFAAQYGGYPRLNVAKKSADAGDFLKCLTGKMALRVKDGRVIMSLVARSKKSFVDISKLSVCDPDEPEAEAPDSNKNGVFIADPWREPYMYLYNTSSTSGTLEAEWTSPSFILFTKGADTKAKEIDNMYSTGVVPDNDAYRAVEVNIDNLIYGRTE